MNKINQPQPKYNFREVVQVINSKYDNSAALNKKGYIGGMAINDDGVWTYGVFLFEYEEVWCFDEDDLKTTGQFVSKDFNKSGETIKIIVNENGEGKIKEDD